MLTITPRVDNFSMSGSGDIQHPALPLSKFVEARLFVRVIWMFLCTIMAVLMETFPLVLVEAYVHRVRDTVEETACSTLLELQVNILGAGVCTQHRGFMD